MKTFLYLTVLCLLATACGSSGTSSPPVDPAHQGEIGITVTAKPVMHMHWTAGHSTELTVPTSGESLTSVSYTISNGTNTYTGTGNLPSANTSGSFLVGAVAAGANYTVALTGTTTDGLAICTGTSATFTVQARRVNQASVQLACAPVSADAGIVAVNANTNACPLIGIISGSPYDNVSGTITAPSTFSGTETLYISAQSLPQSDGGSNALTFQWLWDGSPVGAGFTVTQIDNTDSSLSFVVSGSGTHTVSVVASDGTGMTCPTSDTTATATWTN